MFLERNLFSIYRIVIKTPKLILVAALVFTCFIAFSQIVCISRNNKTIDLSSTLLNYMILKNKNRQIVNSNTTTSNGTLGQSNTTMNLSNNTNKSNDYTLLDDSTILHFMFRFNTTQQISINYDYNQQSNTPPFMIMIKNERLLSLQKVEKKYLQKHGITYDLITIPPLQVEKPFFIYFYVQKLQSYQIMMHSLRQSFIALDTKFAMYRMSNNLTQVQMRTDELYLSFQLQQKDYPLSLNFFQFMYIKFIPSAFFKFIYCNGIFILTIATNIFMGLLVRYLIMCFFTVYLFVYERYNAQGQGWVHQYLAILYRRYGQNKVGTLKILLFYILSNILMPLLLTLGAYCVLFKLIVPSIPLLIQDEAVFYLKTMFFIQIFHYVMCRSRTAIKFFPIFSFIPNFTILTIACLKYKPNTLLLINLNMTIQIINFVIFILVEKLILEQNQKGLQGLYCPSMTKPRMMFYAGYDVSWQKSLPPIWTYFTGWFDYSFFNESQKSLMEKDYQLLYGRMLGLNDRQEIPEYEIELREQHMVPALHDEPSNQMNLVQVE